MTPVGLMLRVGGVCLLLAAAVAGWIGLHPPGGRRDATPLPVAVGRSIRLPSPGLFGRSIALYGVATSTGSSRRELGCVLRTGDGAATNPAKLSELAALSWAPATVAGRRLRPLLVASGYSEGWTLDCDGPAAAASQPLYLLEGRGSTAVLRGTAFGAAALALLLGSGTLLVLRRSR